MTDPAPWSALHAEWDAWQAQGRIASMWLRDDDACRPGPKLARLLRLSDGVPLGLAAIPAMAEQALAEALSPHPDVRVLQHGFRHQNHAGEDQKKAEFGADRPVEEMQAEVREGWQTIRDLFAERAVAIFVPPWNRIDPRLAQQLPACGPALLSVYGARKPEERADRVNAHVDIIDWRGNRCFVGEDAAVGRLVRHLRDRRAGRADPEEPTGILSHHNDHDDGCWNFLTRLLEKSRSHPAARWLDPATFPTRGG